MIIIDINGNRELENKLGSNAGLNQASFEGEDGDKESPFLIKPIYPVEIRRVEKYDLFEDKKRKKYRTFLENQWQKAMQIYTNLSVQGFFKSLGYFLKLYGESLQQLVQGYREVTMDSTNSFRFEKNAKGEELTVQNKLDRFEKRLGEAMGEVKSTIKSEKLGSKITKL